jgi:hypothetical protein
MNILSDCLCISVRLMCLNLHSYAGQHMRIGKDVHNAIPTSHALLRKAHLSMSRNTSSRQRLFSQRYSFGRHLLSRSSSQPHMQYLNGLTGDS